jgi:PP-loop superfamily ATP-utilizing enzyme
MNFNVISEENPVVCWFSGGVTSAIACKLAIDLFGKNNCMILFIDTKNEDEDTYRFLEDCATWYNAPIFKIRNKDYNTIEEVWYKFKGLNFAHGAICSSELKRTVRQRWQSRNNFSFQVFGFDIDEPKRARAFTLNYKETNPIYPLLMFGYSKQMCVDIVQDAGIIIPKAYRMGLNNNNCLNTGCVQGGIGYWQLIQKIAPEKFDRMAEMEHRLTKVKGSPVTMLKDQSKKAKEENNQLVFLKPHPDYPNIKDISMMKGRKPKPLMDCNGFCGIDDLERNPTEEEINRQE